MPRFLKELWESIKEIVTLLLILIFSLFLISRNEASGIKKFRILAFSTFASVSSITSSLFPSGSLRSENERLRRQNANLMLQLSLYQEYASENIELKNLLKVVDSLSYPMLPVQVAFRSISLTQTTIVLKAGRNNGLEPGFVVISENGLVGIISDVSDDYSSVKTLKSSTLSLIVRERKTKYQGILRWDGTHSIINYIPKTADIKIGDTIVSAPSSSIINLPIVIGRVKRIINPEQGYLSSIEIEFASEFEKSENLLVIMEKQKPTFLSGDKEK